MPIKQVIYEQKLKKELDQSTFDNIDHFFD